MKNNLAVGVTGGIGSGKTIACRIFKILDVPVYDADSRARYILNNNPDLKVEIVSLFGERAYSENGLNHEWIAENVFKDQDKLKKLNRLVHPKVGQDFNRWHKGNNSSPYVIKEAALLFESGSYKTLDKVVVVTAPEDLRIRRVLMRDKHRTLEQVKEILRRQWPEDRKIEKADHIITNDGNHMVLPQVLSLHNEFLKLTGPR